MGPKPRLMTRSGLLRFFALCYLSPCAAFHVARDEAVHMHVMLLVWHVLPLALDQRFSVVQSPWW